MQVRRMMQVQAQMMAAMKTTTNTTKETTMLMTTTERLGKTKNMDVRKNLPP